MTTTAQPTTGGPERADRPPNDDNGLLGLGTFFRRGTAWGDKRQLFLTGGREGDVFYRDRWSHDKVVRSTHGVNCTGSCSWKVYVKDGIITWEAQQTDYPDTGPDLPDYEPRGCPRGAAFSWYTYSPTRVRYPYARSVLLRLWREAKAAHPDPVDAWQSIVEDPDKARAYKSQRGKGGLVRISWDTANEIAAAAHVYTIKRYGPDRLAGFSVIPAMSQVSYSAGTRFYSLLGGTILSFYDWYADLPMASPQVFGDQTDVPESGDWYNSSYLMMWGSNVPVTRTPDAHFMTEVRYRGTKVVAVSPDYADNTKFADEWMAIHPGTDGALGLAMGHVILRDFHVAQGTPYFLDYMKKYTDAPYLVALAEHTAPDGTRAYVPGKFLTAEDLPGHAAEENAAFRTVMLDRAGTPQVPNGSLGHRFGESGKGRWNLDLGDLDPALSVLETGAYEPVELLLPRFDVVPEPGDEDTQHLGASAVHRRGVPARRIGDRLVTTVYDLMLAQYGVERADLPGAWPRGEDDEEAVGTPGWAETITGVPAAQITRVAREFARNAADSGGRSMILMGAGTNHYFHSDTIYRTMIALVMMCGCQGRNGGGWAHYVGQEKVRPITGFQQYAFALDWQRPTRHMTTASYWYLATDQWRYDGLPADALLSPLAGDRLRGRTTADALMEANKRGWMPSYPTFDRSSLQITEDAAAAGMEVPAYVVDQLQKGGLRYACEDPDNPENFPRVVTNWRTNLIGSSAKGAEYFHKHLLGATNAVRAAECGPDRRPVDMIWRDEAATGKVDLFMTMDFRMTSTTLHSDLVLPAATWYEKHDISTTDMHPFIHSFNPAIAPPWESRTDYEVFRDLAGAVSELAKTHLGTRRDLLAAPLSHDTPDALGMPHGATRPLAETPMVPGVTMPKLITVERDYTAIRAKFDTIGPLPEKAGMPIKGVLLHPEQEIAELARMNGVARSGPCAGRPLVDTDVKAAEMILRLSGTSNGHLATQGFHTLEQRTGTRLADLAAENEGRRITFADTAQQPQPVITSPEWSGSETGGRRYSAFVQNVERDKPWHTLTGRMHFFLDHDWMADLGENLPTFKPPLDMHRLFGDARLGSAVPGEAGAGAGLQVGVRYLTPHNKWSIHSEYQDNLYMLSLSRGGPNIWMSPADAAKIGVKDNEWVESFNRNGVVVARAVVSHRMPEGTVFMHHATERTVDVPRSETSGTRGGIHNSLTRVLMKPTHLIGGYAQHAYAFNYVGPTGNQRDEVTVIRRRSQEVQY
ncbi:nitrate reductase subunit alpha [Raineyella sp.]|uniref:nitrate reductase subunit alpha n=1 Tax=Raineyella sp. TaxID=1911550 RepID=UPI002B1EEFDB|nr:nitrate reductase subunit alpha [Raineyella sp.]MEA5154160.1 nitrate reductase subunit alpha [Raineyella sp.]